jgi:hypothetical protein
MLDGRRLRTQAACKGLTAKERELLEERLKKVMNQREDQVIFLDLGSASRSELPEITSLGLVYRPQNRGSVVP